MKLTKPQRLALMEAFVFDGNCLSAGDTCNNVPMVTVRALVRRRLVKRVHGMEYELTKAGIAMAKELTDPVCFD